MLKITLGPLDSEIARKMAERRGVNIDALVSALLREEAVVEVAGWRPIESPAVKQQDSQQVEKNNDAK